MKLFDFGSNNQSDLLKKNEIELPNGFKRDYVCDIATTVSTPEYIVPEH